jgi:hypothetical protein
MHSRDQKSFPICPTLFALAFFLCTGVGLICPMVVSAFVDSADTSSQHHSSSGNPSSCGDELSNSSGTVHLLDPLGPTSTAESVFIPLGSSATIPHTLSDTPHSIGGPPLFLRLSTLRN